ncbi:hypothetical protein [Luteimonas sp. SDU101]|uniref:hypothetical protein n=1 Tax=Luteimonas sp. SDU101 TaxID=3422593 RepID=UPI003EB6C912
MLPAAVLKEAEMQEGPVPAATSPWSFFVPIALAVLVGGVIAGLILRGLDAAPDDREASAATASAKAGAETATHEAGRAVPNTEAAPATETAPVPGAHPVAQNQAQPPADADAPPALPGAMLARRDGAPAACIHGTIALRDENGWQQQLENDAPVACVEAPAAAP